MTNKNNKMINDKICTICLIKAIIISSIIYFLVLSSLLFFFHQKDKKNNEQLSYQSCYGDIYAFAEKESTSICIKNPFPALVSRPVLKNEIKTIVISDSSNISFPVSKIYCSTAIPITGNKNMVNTIIYNELSYNVTSWLCSVG